MLEPRRCGNPARMGNDARIIRLCHEGGAPSHQLTDRLPPTRAMRRKVGDPDVNRRLADLFPLLTVPVPEVQFRQPRVDAMHPAPGHEPSTDIEGATQRRRDDDACRTMAPGPRPDPVRQPLGLPSVDDNIGRADAAPRDLHWPRMSPDGQATHLVRPSHVTRISSSTTCWVAPSVSPVYPPRRRRSQAALAAATSTAATRLATTNSR